MTRSDFCLPPHRLLALALQLHPLGRQTDLSSSLASLVYVPRFFDPGATSGASLRDESLRYAPSAWPSEIPVSSACATNTYFEDLFRGPHTRCLRFTFTVARVNARLASAGGFPLSDRHNVFNLLGRYNRFQSCFRLT